MSGPKVVYDYDDVLWGLNQRAFARLNIPLAKNTDFHVHDNPHLTAEEKNAIIATFMNPETFMDIDFFDHVQEILEVEKLGATVYINSNCYNREILELKFAQLTKLLPQINPEHIQFNLIKHTATSKRMDSNTDIFIDDSPYNIATSSAKINILPTYAWNSTAKAKAQMQHQSVIWCKNLHEINQLVYQTVKNMVKDRPAL